MKENTKAAYGFGTATAERTEPGAERKENGESRELTARMNVILEADGFVKVYEDLRKLRNDFVSLKMENADCRAVIGRAEWFGVLVGENRLPSALFRNRRSAENWAAEVNSLSPGDYRIVSYDTSCVPFRIEEK